ncbi:MULTISPECIES: phage tail protein [unclassified Clostridium]|uniref:phage tail protein n=1 Tax=unclassified Clostridium TaxID=2614128 RepID=UPI0025C5C8C7|nr:MULTISPECIES: phage tail protein [unclassified Clostridium]
MSNNFTQFSIDHTLKAPKLKMTLYRNQNNAIGKINNYFELEQEITMGEINKITFSIPYYIEKNNEKVVNPLFDKIKSRHYVRVKYNNIDEWHIVTNQKKSSDGLKKVVSLQSTPCMLKETDLYNYNVVSATIKEICNGNILRDIDGILKDTVWSLSHVDDTLMKKKRGIELNGQSNVLDAIFQIAKKFNAIIEWNTINNSISFYDEETYGNDNGLVFQYNRYLENLDEENNSDEIVTILKVQGKDGISINTVNPTGQSYLTDYSYFLYPYEEDSNGNVIRHSDYMDDDLCKAIIKFDEAVIKNKGKLQELIQKQIKIEEALTIKEIQLDDLRGILSALESRLNIAQSTNSAKDKVIKEKEKTIKQIENKQEEIDYFNKQIKIITAQINSLKYELSEVKNFTPTQLEELKKYKIVRTYKNDNITDVKELMMAAQEDFNRLKMPKKITNIGIINFIKVVEAQKDWEKLIIGDVVTINYHEFGIDKTKARITNIKLNHEDNSIQLSISTFDFQDKQTQIAKMLYNASSASAIVSETRHDVDNLKNLTNNMQEILYKAWEAGQRQVIAGADDKTIINHLGLTSWDKDNKNLGIRVNNGTLQITNEGENHFKKFIDGNGIDASLIKGKLSDSVDVIVTPDRVVDASGNSITSIMQDHLSDLENEFERQLWQQAKQNYDMTDELAYYIDGLTGDLGVFKIETQDMLASKVSDETFKSYQIQTSQLISSKVESSEFTSYRTQTDRVIANMVRDIDGNSSQIAMNSQMIGTKVSDYEFTSAISQLSYEISSKVSEGEIYSIIRQSSSAVEYAFNDISPSVTMDRYGIKLGRNCSIDCESINSTDSGNPIIRLFGECSLDATYNNEQGRGSAIRLKWDRYNYIRIESGAINFIIDGQVRAYVDSRGFHNA